MKKNKYIYIHFFYTKIPSFETAIVSQRRLVSKEHYTRGTRMIRTCDGRCWARYESWVTWARFENNKRHRKYKLTLLSKGLLQILYQEKPRTLVLSAMLSLPTRGGNSTRAASDHSESKSTFYSRVLCRTWSRDLPTLLCEYQK